MLPTLLLTSSSLIVPSLLRMSWFRHVSWSFSVRTIGKNWRSLTLIRMNSHTVRSNNSETQLEWGVARQNLANPDPLHLFHPVGAAYGALENRRVGRLSNAREHSAAFRQ